MEVEYFYAPSFSKVKYLTVPKILWETYLAIDLMTVGTQESLSKSFPFKNLIETVSLNIIFFAIFKQ